MSDTVISVPWRDVLDCKRKGTRVDLFAKEAARLGYEFFAFNGSLYLVERDGCFVRLPIGVPEPPPVLPLDTAPDPIE
jgi:hypothetical protein